MLEGINDIGHGANLPVQRIIGGYRQLIERSHAAGVKIYGATLTPFEGSYYWTPRHRAMRDAVNRWIRRSGAFDGIIDFAATVADPRNPEKLRRAYDSGDHLHPNDAGYRAMARAVNLDMLLRASQHVANREGHRRVARSVGFAARGQFEKSLAERRNGTSWKSAPISKPT